MFLVTCPQFHDAPSTPLLKLFIAGGISECRNWQSDLIGMLEPTDFCVFNPRRERFPVDDPAAMEFQVDWEHRHLTAADIVSFWFLPETLCPISLFELGKVAMSQRELFVGLHPDYRRRLDVGLQLAHVRPEVKPVYTIEELASQLIDRGKRPS